MSYKRLCDFSHLPKTGNYVITWRGMKNFNRKPQLVGGGEFWPDIPKISFRNRPVSSINSGHTNIYNIYLYIINKLQLRFNSIDIDIIILQ